MAKDAPPSGHDDLSSLVDVSLIDAMLALSPEERLRQNDRMIRTILQLRQGLEKIGPNDGQEG